jgi:2-amino-4-hydroxy-6-hydroxymethyldihydropteridine diphosphokinase
MRYFLSLGSNIGDRYKNLAQAVTLIREEGVKVIKISSMYETQPVDLPSQPWFINQVIEAHADIKPDEFIGLLKRIEQKMGRKTSVHKRPRSIDIDILLADKLIVKTGQLEIPHPRLDQRNFVLVPLCEISPRIRHPLLGHTVKSLLKRSKDPSSVNKIKKTYW